MGFWSNLFGGGKSKQAKAVETRPATPGGDVIRVATPQKVKAEAVKPSAVAAPVADVRAALKEAGATGFGQARLRMRLVAAQRAGDIEAAYEAALGLEAIQLQAGRRVGARVWREQADLFEAQL